MGRTGKRGKPADKHILRTVFEMDGLWRVFQLDQRHKNVPFWGLWEPLLEASSLRLA